MTKAKITVTQDVPDTSVVSAKQIAASGIVLSPEKIDEDGAFGWSIVVVDRGFVYVGNSLRHGDSIYCANGYNIRTWGAKRGLGELAMTGPTGETELDPVSCVIIPMRAIIHIIPAKSDPKLWAKASKRLDNV